MNCDQQSNEMQCFLSNSKGGELHFLQIGGVCEDLDDGDMFIDAPLSKGVELLQEGAKPSSNPSSPGISGRTHKGSVSVLK